MKLVYILLIGAVGNLKSSLYQEETQLSIVTIQLLEAINAPTT